MEEYNAAKGTSYSFLKGATLENTSIIIVKGEYASSESLKVVLDPSHKDFMDEGTDYILPIAITGTSEPKQISISESSRIFLTFKANYIPNYISATSPYFYIDSSVSSWKDDFGKVKLDALVRSSYSPYEDVEVSLEIDPALVDKFNQTSEDECSFPEGCSLSCSVVKISPSGTSAGLELTTGDLSLIENEGSYVVPIRIKAVKGAEALLSENEAVAFVELSGKKPAISSVEGPVGNIYSYNDNMDAYDNEGDNYYSYYAVWGDTYWYAADGAYIIVDLAETICLKSFCFTAYSAWYYPAILGLEVSTDGQNWTDYGTAEGVSEQDNYFVLNKSANVRYLKLTVVQGADYGTYLQGLTLYTR